MTSGVPQKRRRAVYLGRVADHSPESPTDLGPLDDSELVWLRVDLETPDGALYAVDAGAHNRDAAIRAAIDLARECGHSRLTLVTRIEEPAG